MKVEFTTPLKENPGIIARLLGASYAELLEIDSAWKKEQENWEDYDRQVFTNPGTVGSCIFLTRVNGKIAGFGSWDPRQRPEYGILGHNCILPGFRGKGLGKLQVEEILARLKLVAIRKARVSTNDHVFFIPAQRMYISCGFREFRRFPWERDPDHQIIEYEKILT